MKLVSCNHLNNLKVSNSQLFCFTCWLYILISCSWVKISRYVNKVFWLVSGSGFPLMMAFLSFLSANLEAQGLYFFKPFLRRWGMGIFVFVEFFFELFFFF